MKMYPISSKAVIDPHSIEDIAEYRTTLLSRFHQLKSTTIARTLKLQEVKKFRYFEREIDEFLLLLSDMIDSLPEEHLEDLVNLQAKVCKHEDIDSELRARESERDVLEQLGLQMIAENHSDSETIRKKICDMKEKWQSLSSKLMDQIEMLRTKQYFIEFVRSFDKFIEWMKKKVTFLSEARHFLNLDTLEKYISEFTQMEKKVFRMEVEVEELRATADFFIKDDYPQSYNVSQKKENLNFCWKTLKEMIEVKRKDVSALIRLHKLCCRADEFIAWIDRKIILVQNEGYGTDLPDIMVLQGKNDGIVRILEQLELRFEEIMKEHDLLYELHSEFTTGILLDKNFIQHRWLELKDKVKERRRKLKERYKILKLNSDVDSMVAWINELKSVLSSQDISEEVADGEVTLAMLTIYKNLMDSRNVMINDIFQTGGGLLLIYHEKFEEINGKLMVLFNARQTLQDLFESQQKKYQKRVKFQIQHRDCDQIENWLERKKAFLSVDENLLNSLDGIQQLMEQQKEFEVTFESELKGKKILYDLDILREMEPTEIERRTTQLYGRVLTLKSELKNRTALLKDAFELQLFYTDCDDIESWITEKVKIVDDKNYLDESRVNSNIASNGLFVNELSSYCNVIAKIRAKEQEFIKRNHYATETIQKRVKGILDSWLPLVEKATAKTSKLDEILDSRCFLLINSELELNMNEYKERIEHLLNDGDNAAKIKIERNLNSISFEVGVFQRSIDNMKTIGLQLIQKGHYDSENIAKKIDDSSKRYKALINMIEEKKKIVSEARKAWELFADMEDQIEWMKGKIKSLTATKTDLSLPDIQHLVVKHETDKSTMITRTNEFVRLQDTAHEMISNNHQDSGEIQRRLKNFVDTWSQLNEINEQFVKSLEQSKRIHDYFAEAELSELFMKDKNVIMSKTEFGKCEDSSAALLKRHLVNIDDLKAYGNYIENLRIQAESCKVNSKNGEPTESSCPVLKRQDELEKLYDDLMNLAEERRHKLENTHEAFVLLRETAEMFSWIALKQIYIQDEDIGESVAQVEIMQKKFDNFESEQTERKIKLIRILTKTEELCPLIHDELKQQLLDETERVKSQMMHLQELTKNRKTLLDSTHELQRFYREVDDIEDWIKEKNKQLNDSVDNGDSLKKIRSLLRKHEGVERDLDALEESIEQLNDTANRLIIKYPDAAEEITSKQTTIDEEWKKLYQKAVHQKQNLLDSYDLQKFFADYDHLRSWIHKMITLMKSIEGACDPDSAEVLKINFQGFEAEIETYSVKLQTIDKFGQLLINSNQNVADEIKEKLEYLRLTYQLLENKKSYGKVLVDQNLVVNSFLKTCEDIETWLAHKKALLNSTGDKEELGKILKRLEPSISLKEKEITSLQESANKLNSDCDLHKDRIMKKCDEVTLEWQKLKDIFLKMSSEIQESQSLQQFSLDAAEIEYWIDERLLYATQENYRDPVNIKSKLLKHQAFEAENSKNARRVYNVLEYGRRLIQSEQSQDTLLAVEKRLEKISKQWNILMNKTKEKSEKLKEVSKQYDHIIAIKYMNFWMGDVETTLLNQDIGRDLNAVQNLLGQHKVIEEDIEAHWGKIKDLENEANIFTGDSIFDIVSIKDEHNNMISRYMKIKNLAEQRKGRLNEKNSAFLLFKEIEDTEAWIREVTLRIENEKQPKFECDGENSTLH